MTLAPYPSPPPAVPWIRWPATGIPPQAPPVLYNSTLPIERTDARIRVSTFLSAPCSREAGRGLLNSPDQETESTPFSDTHHQLLRVKTPTKKPICSPISTPCPPSPRPCPSGRGQLCNSRRRGRGFRSNKETAGAVDPVRRREYVAAVGDSVIPAQAGTSNNA